MSQKVPVNRPHNLSSLEAPSSVLGPFSLRSGVPTAYRGVSVLTEHKITTAAEHGGSHTWEQQPRSKTGALVFVL